MAIFLYIFLSIIELQPGIPSKPAKKEAEFEATEDAAEQNSAETQSNGTAKGQLISKGLFGVFNSSKKRTKKFDLASTMVCTSSRIIFVRFLEELKTPKRHFGIN